MQWVSRRGLDTDGIKLMQLLLEPHRQIGMYQGLACNILRKDKPSCVSRRQAQDNINNRQGRTLCE